MDPTVNPADPRQKIEVRFTPNDMVEIMNVFSYVLAEEAIDDEPGYGSGLVVDDNIGEAVHIHYRNVRLEFSVDDFIRFGEECESAAKELEPEIDNGNR